jgi:hypothetical protein
LRPRQRARQRHFAVIPEHFQEWWGFGLFFVSIAVAQLVWAMFVARWQPRLLIWFGVVGNAAIVALWIVTRTAGTLVGPDGDTPEPIGFADSVAPVKPCNRRVGENGRVPANTVNEDAVRYAKRLIDARQYVLRSRWQDVQPRAREQNAFVKTHSWEEYAAWHLGLTEDAAEETKARYAGWRSRARPDRHPRAEGGSWVQGARPSRDRSQPEQLLPKSSGGHRGYMRAQAEPVHAGRLRLRRTPE